MDQQKFQFSRRQFLGTSLIGLAGITLLPLKSCTKPAEGIKLGFIGLGRQAMYLLNSFINLEGVSVIAGADVYAIKRERFLKRVEAHYQEAGKKVKVKMYEDYRALLENKDVDAVVIASPDHWHALMAIDACKAGKDIYLEKPLTLTILEGQLLVKAVRENNRILAVGSQQRSDPNFQHAVNLALTGKLGTLQKVNVWVGSDPYPKLYDMPTEPLPEGLNWDMWTGPAPKLGFNKELNPPISLDPVLDEEFWGGWRWFKEFGGGLMTDWGAHMFDIAQWGIGYDKKGPVKIIPAGFEGTPALTYVYDNGLNVTLEDFREGTRGVRFMGSDAWIEVARGYFEASDPSLKVAEDNSEVPYEGRAMHHVDFIEAIKNRREPAVPVEVGHKTCVTCTLGNIAKEIERPINWNPDTESIDDDSVAQSMLHREYLNGYKL